MKEWVKDLLAVGIAYGIIGVLLLMDKSEYQRDMDMVIRTVTIGNTRNVKIEFVRKRVEYQH